MSEVVLTLSRAAASFAKPVRLLIVERDKSSWWTTFIREDSQSESAEIVATQHGEPLDLPGMTMEAILQLAHEVVTHGTEHGIRRLPANSCKGCTSLDPRGRPLFAMIVARSRSRGNRPGKAESTTSCTQERGCASSSVDSGARKAEADGEPPAPRHASERFVTKGKQLQLSRYQRCRGLATRYRPSRRRPIQRHGRVAAGKGVTLAGIQPDILGERIDSGPCV